MTTSMTSTHIPAGDFTVDTAHSHVGFVARHAMVTKVRGSFDSFEASAHFDPEDLAGSWARVSVEVASVTTRSPQRDEHLRSADFFDVATYPHLTFTSTTVEIADDTTLRVTGDLTIKGTSRPVTLDFAYTGSATDPFGNERVGFEGQLVVNRRDWDLTWNAALETGGVLVSDKVTLELELSAIRSA